MSENKNSIAGSCIVIDDSDRILILLRSTQDSWKPLWWDLPGGYIEHGETPEQGAAREAKEESGLIVKNIKKIQVLQIGNLTKYFFVTRNYSGNVSIEPNPVSGIIEHDDSKWVTIEELENIQNFVVDIEIIKKALEATTN
jgi:mutator protein MutT